MRITGQNSRYEQGGTDHKGSVPGLLIIKRASEEREQMSKDIKVAAFMATHIWHISILLSH